MLKLSKLADYALLILHTLAAQKQDGLTGNGLAEITGLPLPTVRKILTQLLEHKLVQSTPGSRGGYTLSKSTSAITLYAILNAIDGEWALTACFATKANPDNICVYENFCQLKHSWNIVNTWLMRMLSSISLEDMSSGLHQHDLNKLFAPAYEPIKDSIA